jgi:hypothetical protein
VPIRAPADGPNYGSAAALPDHVDNNGDGIAEVKYRSGS